MPCVACCDELFAWKLAIRWHMAAIAYGVDSNGVDSNEVRRTKHIYRCCVSNLGSTLATQCLRISRIVPFGFLREILKVSYNWYWHKSIHFPEHEYVINFEQKLFPPEITSLQGSSQTHGEGLNNKWLVWTKVTYIIYSDPNEFWFLHIVGYQNPQKVPPPARGHARNGSGDLKAPQHTQWGWLFLSLVASY